MSRPDVSEPTSQLLAEFLREEFKQKDLPVDLWSDLESRYGEDLYAEILYFLTQIRFDPVDAREHWQRIEQHRSDLTKTNRRDPGLRVAMADYFINIQPLVDNPVMVELNLLLKKEETALRDELTGLYNRRFFNRTLRQEMERARRFEQCLSLLMIDVDHFKQFNDRFGHPAGDKALAEVGKVLGATCRCIDHLTRYGGEEFAVILPRSDRRQALFAAERVRSAVADHPFLNGLAQKLTISLGVSTFPMDAHSGLELVENSDRALYEAKNTGRNRVVACRDNKRRHPRFPVELALAFREKNNRADFQPGIAKNMSVGGMLWATQCQVPKGANLEFRLPDKNGGIEINGRCLRVNPDPVQENAVQLGVEFLPSSENEVQALESLIDPMQ